MPLYTVTEGYKKNRTYFILLLHLIHFENNLSFLFLLSLHPEIESGDQQVTNSILHEENGPGGGKPVSLYLHGEGSAQPSTRFVPNQHPCALLLWFTPPSIFTPAATQEMWHGGEGLRANFSTFCFSWYFTNEITFDFPNTLQAGNGVLNSHLNTLHSISKDQSKIQRKGTSFC